MTVCQYCSSNQPWTAEQEFKLQDTKEELRFLKEQLAIAIETILDLTERLVAYEEQSSARDGKGNVEHPTI